MTPSDRVIPVPRRGWRFLRRVLVVYSADRGIIVTGYQVTGRQAAAIPEDAQWLK